MAKRRKRVAVTNVRPPEPGDPGYWEKVLEYNDARLDLYSDDCEAYRDWARARLWESKETQAEIRRAPRALWVGGVPWAGARRRFDAASGG